MFSKTIIFLLAIFLLSLSLDAKELSNREEWLKDKDFIEGIMYLKGKKGFSFIEKSINNCPYDKCKKADVNKKDILNITTLKIKKNDYKKAIRYLSKSSKNGNILASDELVIFLKGRLPYKTKNPESFLLDILRKETGLSYSQYSKLFYETTYNGYKNGGCSSSYYYAEILEHGYMGVKKDLKRAKKAYLQTFKICPKNSFFKLVSSSKSQ